MSKLWTSVLGLLQEIGDKSGCHQMPERSFQINGYMFPVCARCTGVFIGQLSAVIAILAGLRLNLAASAILLLLMGLDWLIQHLGIKESNNVRRLITGIAGGFGLFCIYSNIIILVVNKVMTII